MLGGDEEFVGDDRQGDGFAFAPFELFLHAGEGAEGIVIEVPAFEGVVIDTIGGHTHDECLAFELLDGDAVTDVTASLERFDMEDLTGFDHELDVACALLGKMLDVLVGKMQHLLAALGDEPSAEPDTEDAEEGSGDEIGSHEPVIAHAGGMHGDELGVACHFAGEEDDGEEDEQGAEHVHVVRDEGEVVVGDDLPEGYLVLEEIIHLLGEVKDDGNGKNEHDREEERAQEFPYYVPVEAFHADL